MAKGSTWMKAKMAKLAQERRANFNPMTTVRRPGHTIERSNHMVFEIAQACERYTGVVTLCPVADKTAREDVGRMGKNKRALDKSVGPRGGSVRQNAATYYDLWETSDRLIRNGQVVG